MSRSRMLSTPLRSTPLLSTTTATRSGGVLVDPDQFFAGAAGSARTTASFSAQSGAAQSGAAQSRGRAKQPLRTPSAPLPVAGRVPRRPLLLLAGLATLIAALLIGGEVASAEQTDTQSSASAVVTVTAQPGDTLWSIARSWQPNGDVRPLVRQLIQLNGSAAIRAGDAVYLPTSTGAPEA
jgi:nucleoid-associated protein YgaU